MQPSLSARLSSCLLHVILVYKQQPSFAQAVQQASEAQRLSLYRPKSARTQATAIRHAMVIMDHICMFITCKPVRQPE